MPNQFVQKNFSTFILLILLGIESAIAASIELTAPLSNISKNDGEDFFADVMYDPIDFDKRRDILWEEHFTESTVTVNNNIWSGDSDGHIHGSYIFPLFQGFRSSVNSDRTGIVHPLDSTKYRYVSLMNKVSQRTVRRMYWSQNDFWPIGDPYKTTGTDGTFLTGSTTEYDGYKTNNTWIFPSNEWMIYLIDLQAKPEWLEAPITGIRFDASPQADANTTIQYKWFRVIDPSSSDNLDITWTTSNVTATNAKVNIYVDTDNVGFDGALLTRASYTDNIFSFPAAALPAGTYYIYLKLYDNVDTDTLLATSQYSAAITINGKSNISFNSPSKTSGPEYATTVVINPWDMNSSVDVTNLTNPANQKCFVNEQFINGTFIAKAVIEPTQVNTAHTDAQVWLNVDPLNPIDTSKYRYLTYTLGADSQYYGNISDKVSRGWISRIMWWSQALWTDGEQTADILLYEDLHSYTVDLYDDIIEPDATLSGQTWYDNPTVAHVRIDPLETSNPEGTIFYLYDVKLTSNPEMRVDGSFTASVTLSDFENDEMSVQFFLDNDNQDYNGTAVGSMNRYPGTYTYTFNTCDLDLGDYYLYTVVTDTAGNITKRYADVPIEVNTPVACQQSDLLDLYMMGILPSIIAHKQSTP